MAIEQGISKLCNVLTAERERGEDKLSLLEQDIKELTVAVRCSLNFFSFFNSL